HRDSEFAALDLMLLSFAFVALSQKASIPLHLLGHPESSSGLHGHDNSSFFFLLTPPVIQRVGNTRRATTSWWRSHIYEPQLACPSILQVQIKF
ncbi:unnamed protein product, partial [Musa banksii]